jgi:hypothetical protein
LTEPMPAASPIRCHSVSSQARIAIAESRPKSPSCCGLEGGLPCDPREVRRGSSHFERGIHLDASKRQDRPLFQIQRLDAFNGATLATTCVRLLSKAGRRSWQSWQAGGCHLLDFFQQVFRHEGPPPFDRVFLRTVT